MSRVVARPPEVLSLTVLLLGAAVMLLIAVAFPMSDGAPIELGYAMLAVALAMAAGTFLFAARLPRPVLLAEAAVVAGLNSILVAHASTPGGAIADALAYIWLAAYVALFFPAAAMPFAAVVSAGFGAGLVASDLPSMLTPWALVSVTVVTFSLALGYVSRVFRRHMHTDPLTGTLNRTGLDRAAIAVFARTRRRGEMLTLAVIDLDAFKEVNDRTGHAGGDRLLVETAHVWRAGLRADDVLARVGGDEFVVLMPATTPDEARVMLARLRLAGSAAWSAGLARWRPDEPLEACLERADGRLYEAKARRAARAA